MAQTTRELVLARRKAMSAAGKAGLPGGGSPAPLYASAPAGAVHVAHSPSNAGRAASLARRRAMSAHGRAGLQDKGRTRNTDSAAATIADSGTTAAGEQPDRDGDNAVHKPQVASPLPDGLSINRSGVPMSAARTVRAGNPEMSGRDMSKAVREQRSKNGNPVGRQSRPCGRVRPVRYSATGAVQDASRKVGTGKTVRRQTVTGTMVGRSPDVTGNEAGTCRKITGTEYPGADILRDFCRAGATSHTAARAVKVSGDESGMARELTGTRYITPADVGNVPAKAGMGATLRGGVTGTLIGRSNNMTGDEAGSCHNITGDDYIGQEQFAGFCAATPTPQDQKVGVSSTRRGSTVTGTLTGRSGRVTGDEPGTCKAITGTPYAGPDQVAAYCEAPAVAAIKARTHPPAGTPAPVMSGQQPEGGGVMTGADKGICKPVTGTPYTGADPFADACPAMPADTASPDFPQTLESGPWGRFSVTLPSGGAAHAKDFTGVTGNRFEAGCDITGPFGMASGKVTGTEEARFGGGIQSGEPRPQVAKEFEGRTKARITGEGLDAGLRITGNDWVRNHHVTGTEGRSAALRNPTLRKGVAATMAVEHKRNEALPVPGSKVTGGSGNTDKGSLITYSGGARG